MSIARSLVAVSAIVAAAHLSARAADAQHVTIGAALAAADYREQGTSLRFRGSGGSAHLDVEYRRFGLGATAMRLAFEHDGSGAVTLERFELTQLDLRLRARLVREFSIEAGLIQRTIAPADAAQEVGAMRVGALASYPLAPGASLNVRAAYLGAARFSGGGSAPFGAELGLGVSYGPGRGRIRATADFDFQHFGRRTAAGGARLDVPIQSAVARIGIALAR